MKPTINQILFVATFAFSTTSYVQNNTLPTTGNVGIGTSPVLTAPVFNLQLHGTSDYLQGGNPVSTPNGFVFSPTQNMGKSVAFGMTNTTTGFYASDGAEFRMTQNNLSILNQENGNFTIGTLNANLTFSNVNSRIWVGTLTNSTDVKYAKYNVNSSDNGIYVRSAYPGKYALRLETTSAGNAIEVTNTTSPLLKQFTITGNGEVFARRYTTTLANIPDYVFNTSYPLMNFSDLRTYISQHQHLPNVPSATEYANNGVDLGEMNRVLLEKVEELTLYILQLEARMKTLENTQK